MNSQTSRGRCGTGSESAIVKTWGEAGVYAVDLDVMAVIRAKENIEMNHCQNILVEKII